MPRSPKVSIEIGRLFSDLDQEIQEAADEVASVRTTTLAEILAKDKKMQKLQRSTFVRVFANILNIVQLFVNDFASAGTTIISGVAAKLSVDKDITTPSVDVPLAAMNGNVFDFIRKTDQEKLSAIEAKLLHLNDSQSVCSTPHEHEIRTSLGNLFSIVQELRSMGASTFIHDKVESLFGQFKNFVNEQVRDLTNEYSRAIESFRSASNALNVIESLPSLYHQYSEDREKIETISAALNADQRLLRKLNKLEAELYSDLLPMFNSLQEFLSTTATQHGQKSSIALYVEEVKIQQRMRQVQKKLSNTMNGLDLISNADIKDSMVKTHETINLLVDIYDHIQSYKEQSNLFVQLSELHSVSYSDIYFENAQMMEILNELQFNLRSNILLAQYDRAIDGFKQAVFPFAADYFQIYRLPAMIAAENDTNAIGTAVDNIRSLSERLKEHNSTVINRNDTLIHKTHFNSESGPFYKWPNNEVQD